MLKHEADEDKEEDDAEEYTTTSPQIDGDGEQANASKDPTKYELGQTWVKYKSITSSTRGITSACCGVFITKSLVPLCKRVWKYPPFRVAVTVSFILSMFLLGCAFLSVTFFAENKPLSYQFTAADGSYTDVTIQHASNTEKKPPQAPDVNAATEDSIIPPSFECKAPVAIRGGDGYEYLEFSHTASHKWIPNADRTDIRPANVTVIFASGVTDSDPERVFRCDSCVNSVPQWIAHRYANQPVQTVAIRTWKTGNHSNSDSLHLAVVGLVNKGIIDSTNPLTNIVWVLQGTAGSDLVRLFTNPLTPFSLKRATRHFIFIDTPFLGSRLATIDELMPFSLSPSSLFKVFSRVTRAEYTDDMTETAKKFVTQIATIPLSLTCLSGEKSMQRFTSTYSMSLILFIMHYFWSILIVLSGTLFVVVGKQGFKWSYFDHNIKILLWVLVTSVFFGCIFSGVYPNSLDKLQPGAIDWIHPAWRSVHLLNHPVVHEMSAKHLCTLRDGSKVDSLPLDYYTMSRPTSPSDDLMVRIRTAIEMNIKKNAVANINEEQMKLKAIDNALYQMQMYSSQPVISVMNYGNRELPQP